MTIRTSTTSLRKVGDNVWEQSFMISSVSRVAVALGGILSLLAANTASGSSAAEVAVAANGSVPSSAALTGRSNAPAIIIAANQRETNLQKTATFIIVSDSGSAKRLRNSR
jgi:hypothetical protein